MDLSTEALNDVVFVRLIGEGTLVYRPAPAARLGSSTFRLIPTPNYDPEDEEWEFEPGSVVRCERRVLEGQEVLVAISAG